MHYYQLGKIPSKRHTQFRKPDGDLYHEQLFSTEGFSDNYSLLYHVNAPTQIVQVGDPISVAPKTIHPLIFELDFAKIKHYGILKQQKKVEAYRLAQFKKHIIHPSLLIEN